MEELVDIYDSVEVAGGYQRQDGDNYVKFTYSGSGNDQNVVIDTENNLHIYSQMESQVDRVVDIVNNEEESLLDARDLDLDNSEISDRYTVGIKGIGTTFENSKLEDGNVQQVPEESIVAYHDDSHGTEEVSYTLPNLFEIASKKRENLESMVGNRPPASREL
jgi:hypothetical protein